MNLLRLGILCLYLSELGHAAPLNLAFNTFVTGNSITAVEGQHQATGFTFAGDKFVGTVYLGTNHNQLYASDLDGSNVRLFGSPLPTNYTGEIEVVASLGHAGFGAGTVYAGAGSTVYRFADSGGTPSILASGLIGSLEDLLFDTGNSFGGALLAVTSEGNLYKIDSSGGRVLLAVTDEHTTGMDIIRSGPLAGALVTVSEDTGRMRIIDPDGTVHLATFSGAATRIPELKSVAYVPLDIGLSGNPLDGYYAASYLQDIQKVPAAQFLAQNLGGHLLATSDDNGHPQVLDIVYAGSGYNFTVQRYGVNLLNHAEDGLFVTTQRSAEAAAPEAPSALLMATGLFAIVAVLRRSRRSTMRMPVVVDRQA